MERYFEEIKNGYIGGAIIFCGDCSRRILRGAVKEKKEGGEKMNEGLEVERDTTSFGKLFEALSKAQAEFPKIQKTAVNPFFNSKYAPLENIIEAVTPALSKHGLSVIQIPILNTAVGAVVQTIIGHASGESISGTMSLVPTKHDPQGMGSAYTYARRYSLAMMLNVAAEDDDDANTASQQTTAKPEVQQPQSKSAKNGVTKCDESKVITGIAGITSTNGVNKKTNKKYTLHKILGEGNIAYQTFDEQLKTLAKSAQEAGLKCEIAYTIGKYGNSITAIQILEPTPIPVVVTKEEDIPNEELPF